MAQARRESVGLALDSDWSRIEALLPEAWQDKARELGAFRRARGLADASTLLRVLLIHLAQGCGLRETAERARLGGLAQISDVAILKRLRGCAAWFEWMCLALRRQWLPQPLAPVLDACWSGHRIRLIDGTMVSEPGATGSQWRLHYSVDFPSLRADEVIVSTRADGETLRRFTLTEGDIGVADRGFANSAGVAHVQAGGGAVVVRTNWVTLPLFECSGVPSELHQDRARPAPVRIDVLALVRTLSPGQCASWPVTVHHNKRVISGRLCAVKKSAASAQKARERVRRESQRGGSQLQPETLEAADYVLVFTTLPASFPVAQIMELYRARWQIEIVFKRLKSLTDLGHLKKHDPEAARAWLQGKLLVALITDALLATAEHFSPWGGQRLQARDNRQNNADCS